MDPTAIQNDDVGQLTPAKALSAPSLAAASLVQIRPFQCAANGDVLVPNDDWPTAAHAVSLLHEMPASAADVTNSPALGLGTATARQEPPGTEAAPDREAVAPTAAIPTRTSAPIHRAADVRRRAGGATFTVGFIRDSCPLNQPAAHSTAAFGRPGVTPSAAEAGTAA